VIALVTRTAAWHGCDASKIGDFYEEEVDAAVKDLVWTAIETRHERISRLGRRPGRGYFDVLAALFTGYRASERYH